MAKSTPPPPEIVRAQIVPVQYPPLYAVQILYHLLSRPFSVCMLCAVECTVDCVLYHAVFCPNAIPAVCRLLAVCPGKLYIFCCPMFDPVGLRWAAFGKAASKSDGGSTSDIKCLPEFMRAPEVKRHGGQSGDIACVDRNPQSPVSGGGLLLPMHDMSMMSVFWVSRSFCDSGQAMLCCYAHEFIPRVTPVHIGLRGQAPGRIVFQLVISDPCHCLPGRPLGSQTRPPSLGSTARGFVSRTEGPSCSVPEQPWRGRGK